MQTLYTIGHSTRSIEDFVGLLTAYDIRELVDVRTIPGSRRHPQFSGEALAALEEVGITYRHLKEPGGLRRPGKDSLRAGQLMRLHLGHLDQRLSQK